ncbi:MAG TPA: hypothetical protein VEV83_17875 [Parafilimonas sp.]|nr:hypothetical protein [Parafilimonas sp.]
MVATNVELSKTELELVTSSDVILTKNRIIEKVYALFGSLSEGYRNILAKYSHDLPVEIFEKAPKIYRGENYMALPYVMLDYPRIFGKEEVFAIRSFFWWGNHFSITLQLSGNYMTMYAQNIVTQLHDRKEETWFIGTNESAWEHHFKEDNYLPLREISLPAFTQRSFVKIAKKIPLIEWTSAEDFFLKNFNELLGLVRS